MLSSGKLVHVFFKAQYVVFKLLMVFLKGVFKGIVYEVADCIPCKPEKACFATLMMLCYINDVKSAKKGPIIMTQASQQHQNELGGWQKKIIIIVSDYYFIIATKISNHQ